MFPYDDNGLEFFNGDIQDQYFNYFLYTQMSGDDPFGVFEDDYPEGKMQDGFTAYPSDHSSTVTHFSRGSTGTAPYRSNYSHYSYTRTEQHSKGSLSFAALALGAFILTLLLVLFISLF